MGKGKSIGKARLDKYYNLAKEKGYRARSAFKLIQMNRKYGFLADAHVLIDLCAAPGGWLQVAAQEMPLRRRIIGVDLEPIKFIGDVDTFVADITSEECRMRLKEILGVHRADVVLHDGAPNVGTSWENDAFNQNLLVLHSLKLATEFLREGGVFVTKIFRSEDYFSLFNVLSKLFVVVETSKPMSSRAQSAEIFLVCQGFVGEESVDQTMLEMTSVFQEKSAGGYEDFNFYKTLRLTDLLREDDPHALLEMLGRHSEIVVDVSAEVADRLLDEDILHLFRDLKVVGKSDMKRIVSRRTKIVKMVRWGEVDAPELDFLKTEDAAEPREWEELQEQTVEDKLEEIHGMIERRRKQEMRLERKKTEVERDAFFEDAIFSRLAVVDDEEETKVEVGEIEVSTSTECSDSLDLSDEALLCIAKLKDDPEGFVEDTVDRYIRDPDEDLPNYLREDQVAYSRPSKSDEKITNKELQALSRRKTRAERRAEKFMRNVIVDDSEEEGEVAKKIYKSSYKKTRTKPRIVFPKKGRGGVPKGRGRVVSLDKRLKKDKKNRK